MKFSSFVAHSEESLARLSDALNTQRGEMKLLENERNVLASTVSALKGEIRRMSEEHDARLHRDEEEVQVLEARNQVALASRRELQITLDITKSVGDEAKSRVGQLEQELLQTKKELLSSHESHRSVLDSRKELQNEANALKMENDELRREKNRIERNRATAEQSLSMVEQENAKLLEATTSREVEVRELSKRLKQREKDQEGLKDKFRRLEADRRQESLELEKLKFSLKSLEASLEDSEKEKKSAEESRLKDKSRIEVLETELCERNRMYDDLLTENRATKAHSRDLEQKLVFAGDEARTQESTIGRLKERCQSLEDKMNETCSDRTFWEEQTKQLNRTVEKLEEETRVLSMEKRTIELKAKQLEERLNTGDELARGDVDRLRVKYLQSERERQELETLLTRYKTEYYDEEQKKSRELVNYKHRVEQLELECRLARQREAETASTKESTISTLQEEVVTCSANLDRANKRCSDLEVDAQKAEERLLAMTEKLDRYRHELIKSREEADAARDKNSSQTALHIQSLTGRLVELEEQLMRATEARESSLKRSTEEDSTIRLLSAGLDSARDELLARQRDIHRLQSDLSDSESAKKEQEAKMAELKAMMDKFQARAKAQFGAFAEEHQDFTKTLEALRGDKENLRARLRKAEMERDACFTCLKDGREKLSDVIHRGKAGEFLEAEIFVNTSTDFRSLPTKVSRRPSADLYLADNSIDQLLALRAEEIAGCLAFSARETIRGTQDENSSLRFRLNSMEVDKRAEVATLKNRIRDIEEDLRGGSVFSRR
jgi:chromosome segregation ATPase